jgi:hypothetical protein
LTSFIVDDEDRLFGLSHHCLAVIVTIRRPVLAEHSRAVPTVLDTPFDSSRNDEVCTGAVTLARFGDER